MSLSVTPNPNFPFSAKALPILESNQNVSVAVAGRFVPARGRIPALSIPPQPLQAGLEAGHGLHLSAGVKNRSETVVK